MRPKTAYLLDSPECSDEDEEEEEETVISGVTSKFLL